MKVDFLGIFISVFNENEIFEKEDFFQLVTANAEIIVKANENLLYRNILSNSEICIDGQIPCWLFNFKNKKIKANKISGSDLIYKVAKYSIEKRKRLFLLGGNEKANLEAVSTLKLIYPNLEISGYSPAFEEYPFSLETTSVINEKLLSFRPDYVFVGFGAEKQERWIFDNKIFLKSIGAKFAVGSGGTFDFVSGHIKRAPRFIQKIGLESLFRLLVEPKFFRFFRIIKSLKIFRYI